MQSGDRYYAKSPHSGRVEHVTLATPIRSAPGSWWVTTGHPRGDFIARECDLLTERPAAAVQELTSNPRTIRSGQTLDLFAEMTS